MKTLSYKTISSNSDTVKRDWYIIDAENLVLGRMCTKIAMILRGKNKAYFSPHVDCGDYVIVINAEKIKLTGNKSEDKEYFSYSGYPGGQKKIGIKDLMAKKPTAVVEKAVKGMLPKNILGRAIIKKLFVYAGPDHTHEAQKPKTIKL